MTTTPTARQIAYARDLQNDIRERMTWTLDRDAARAAFLQPLNPETMAQVRALRAEGRRDEAKALADQAKAEQQVATDAAIDAYLVRRQELAEADIDAMDRAEISEFIDAAKKAFI